VLNFNVLKYFSKKLSKQKFTGILCQVKPAKKENKHITTVCRNCENFAKLVTFAGNYLSRKLYGFEVRNFCKPPTKQYVS
jgi:hypothetical protein